MKTVFLIHGAYGNPRNNWFPWLREELEKQGCICFAPAFPTPHNQSLENWMNVFKPFIKYVNSDTIFVGHSIGAAFVLDVLEHLKPPPLRASCLAAGFISPLHNPRFDQINASFYTKTFDWQKIKAQCKQFYVVHADNDPYVPMEQGKSLAQLLSTNMHLIKGAGHFNTTTFPPLLEKIRALFKDN